MRSLRNVGARSKPSACSSPLCVTLRGRYRLRASRCERVPSSVVRSTRPISASLPVLRTPRSASTKSSLMTQRGTVRANVGSFAIGRTGRARRSVAQGRGSRREVEAATVMTSNLLRSVRNEGHTIPGAPGAQAISPPGGPMPVDPNIQTVLDGLAAMDGPEMVDVSPPEARQMYKLLNAMAGEPEDVASVDDRTIPGPTGDIP